MILSELIKELSRFPFQDAQVKITVDCEPDRVIPFTRECIDIINKDLVVIHGWEPWGIDTHK